MNSWINEHRNQRTPCRGQPTKGLPMQSQKVLLCDLVGPEGTQLPRPGAANCEEGGRPRVSKSPLGGPEN